LVSQQAETNRLSHSRNAVSLFIGVHNEALTVTTIRISHKKIVRPVESTVATQLQLQPPYFGDVANTLTFFCNFAPKKPENTSEGISPNTTIPIRLCSSGSQAIL
jgi:hypothetical protein